MIGIGTVAHRRLRPCTHAFRYPTYFLLLPLRSLRQHPEPLLRRNRWGLISFHDADHGEGGADALSWIETLLTREGITDADGEIWLQTFPRVLGYVFKPVSFWFAHRRDGSLAAVVAEVNNTFGERHVYLLPGAPLDGDTTLSAAKVFHVSPFCRTEGEYRFRFSLQTDPLGQPAHSHARVDLHDALGPLLQTHIEGHMVPVTPSSLRRAFCGTPLMTIGVVLRIHWQALRLWLKRVPFYRKPPAPEHQVSR